MDVACYASLSYMKSNAAHSPGPATGFKYPGQSVRAMPTRILTVGKKRSQGTQLLVDEYKEKLIHYCSVEDVLIRSNPKSTCNVKVQVETEDLLVMQQIRPEDWVYYCKHRKLHEDPAKL